MRHAIALIALAALAGCATTAPQGPASWGYQPGQAAPSRISEAEAETLTSQYLEFKLKRDETTLVASVGICFATLWGTLFPILSEAVKGEKIEVGAPFFNQVNGPLGLLLLALTGIGPLIAWRRASIANLRSAAIYLGHMQLPAPVGGVIAQRQRVRPFDRQRSARFGRQWGFLQGNIEECGIAAALFFSDRLTVIGQSFQTGAFLLHIAGRHVVGGGR